MLRDKPISFATIRIANGIALIAQNQSANPYHPASPIEPYMIEQVLPEGADGRLWGKWNIPIYYDQPRDQSNRETIDTELSEEMQNGEAVRNDNMLYVKLFDDTDDRGHLIEFNDVRKDLDTTEGYDRLVSIVERMEEFGVLNENDFFTKAEAHVSDNLAQTCTDSGLVWEGHVPVNWVQVLEEWLVENNCQLSRYYYDNAEIIQGLRELNFLNPDVLSDELNSEDKQKLDALEDQIVELDRMMEALRQISPRQAQGYEEKYLEIMEELKDSRNRLLLGIQEKEHIPVDARQMELPLDDYAMSHNKELDEKADMELSQKAEYFYQKMKQSMPDYPLDFSDSSTMTFASSKMMVPCGRGRPHTSRITYKGKRTLFGE